MKDRSGLRFGKLVVLEIIGKSKDGHKMWKCKCDCGNYCQVPSNRLTEKHMTRSCGCLVTESNNRKRKPWNIGKRYTTKGEFKTTQAWSKAAIRNKGNRCEICGWDKARCDVHHIISRKNGGLNILDNAKVLCPNCHREHHEIS